MHSSAGRESRTRYFRLVGALRRITDSVLRAGDAWRRANNGTRVCCNASMHPMHSLADFERIARDLQALAEKPPQQSAAIHASQHAKRLATPVYEAPGYVCHNRRSDASRGISYMFFFFSFLFQLSEGGRPSFFNFDAKAYEHEISRRRTQLANCNSI